MGPVVDIRLLGPVSVHSSGRPVALGPRRQRFVLAVLALEVNRAVPVDRLVELAWPDPAPRTAAHAIQVCVSRLRSALAAAQVPRDVAWIETRGDAYALRTDPGTIDVHRFNALLREAGDQADDDRRSALLTEALDLWSGAPLAGAAPEQTRQRLFRGLEEARLTALEDRLDAHLRRGRHREALGELADLAQAHPTRERLVGLRMLALYRDGRAGEALAAYRELRERLAAELGLDPGPELRRLETAILRDEADLKSEAGLKSDGTPPRELPPDVRGFTGRRAELDALDRVLLEGATGVPSGAVTVVAVSGTGGVGKTALATHWAHRVADRFPDGQLYVDLRGFDPGGTALGPGAAVRRLLDALGVPAERLPATLDGQLARYRSVLAGKRVLVVLDNARDAEQVRPLLPGTAGCLALVTSRRQLTGLAATAGAHQLTLDVLTADESEALLLSRLGHLPGAERAALETILARCAGLPLALAIAAARAAAYPTFPLATLAAELRDAAGALAALDGGDPATDVRTVFSWSYRTLSPDAARLFRRLGLHPGPDLPVAAAASLDGVPEERVRPALAELTAAHLLTRPAPGRYGFHDLLRAYAVELGAEDGVDVRRAAVQRVLDHYRYAAWVAAPLLAPFHDRLAVPPPGPGVATVEVPDAAAAHAWYVAEHATLLGCVELAGAEGFDTHAWQTAWLLAPYLHQWGHWDDETAVQRTALAAARRSADPLGQAYAHRGLGSAAAQLGRPHHGYLHHRRALRLLEALGDRTVQARTHLSLAWVSDRRRRPADVLHHARRSLDLYLAVGDRTGEAIARNMVGLGYALVGDHRQALREGRRALALNEELGDRDGQAWTWDSLGYAYSGLGEYERAIECYRASLDLLAGFTDASSSPDLFGFAETYDHLGDAYAGAGRTDDARAAWQRALDLLHQLDHPDADDVKAKLART
jgi:DNA-binding SARP family transcriptional activator